MDILIPRCCGIDVHQKSLVACVCLLGQQGTVTRHLRTFGTMTDDLRALAAWLQEAGVTHAAIESTGVLWKPVWNVLESTVTLVLVSPRDVKQVPGRKTDVSDGVSGRAMLRAVIAGEPDAVALANLARRSLRRKIPQLQRALAGHVTAHHRFVLDDC